MNRRQRQAIIAAVAASIGIALIVGVIWFMSKEHRFQEYHNKQHGFSISYPASWSLEENKGGAAVIFFTPQENALDFFKESLNVVVQDISANPMTLKVYSEVAIKQMELVFKENLVILDSGPALLSDQAGHKFVFIGKGPDAELQYLSMWTLRGTTAYQVTYTALSSQYDRYLPKIKRMIRSFRID